MIIEGIKEKKGKNIVVIDFTDIIHSPCSFFVICSATSTTQINAIANNIEKKLIHTVNLKKWTQEGIHSSWRLIDYSNIVIHIFTNDARERYKLEELWGDANIKRIK